MGPDRPTIIIKIELRIGSREVDVGIPVSIDGTDIAPVGCLARPRAHRALLEPVRHGLAAGHDARNDVLAEIVAGLRVARIAGQFGEKIVGIKDIDTHAGECPIRVVRQTGRIQGLFHEGRDEVVGIHRHHAERPGVEPRYFDAGHRTGFAMRHVFGERHRIIHFVDVIARQDDQIFRPITGNDVLILVYGIRRPLVPVGFVQSLLCGHHINEFIEFATQEPPAALDVAHQTVTFVLGEYTNAANARIEAIGEREIDNAKLATEIHCRLGPSIRQIEQTTAAAAGKHQRHGPFGQIQADSEFVRKHTSPPELKVSKADRPRYHNRSVGVETYLSSPTAHEISLWRFFVALQTGWVGSWPL